VDHSANVQKEKINQGKKTQNQKKKGRNNKTRISLLGGKDFREFQLLTKGRKKGKHNYHVLEGEKEKKVVKQIRGGGRKEK